MRSKIRYFRGKLTLSKILPTKTYRNAPNAVHVVKRTKLSLMKLTAIQVQRIFYPTKITRYNYGSAPVHYYTFTSVDYCS